MSRTINPVNTSDTFQVWLQRTNDLVSELGTSVVTASTVGDTTAGNATLLGTFAANTVTASSLIRTGVIDTMVGNTTPLEIRSQTKFSSTNQTPIIIDNSLGPRVRIKNNAISWLAGIRGSAGTGTDAQFVIGVEGSDFAFRIGTDGTIYANNIILDSDSSSPTGVVRANRTINTTDGIVGGGNLTADRTFSLTGNALAFHNLSANGIVTKTGTGTAVVRTLTQGSGITITNGNGVSGNPTVAIDASVATLSGSQTFTGVKTFSSTLVVDKGLGSTDDMIELFTGTAAVGNPYLYVSKTSSSEFNVGGFNGTSNEGTLNLNFTAINTGSKITSTNNITIRNSGPTLNLRDTESNSAMLHVNSNIFYVLRGGTDTEEYTQVNGQWPMYLDLSNNNAVFGNNILAGGSITAYSDQRLKSNIRTVENAIELVSLMRGVFFDKDGRVGVGVIAQEMESVLPEVVVDDDRSGYKSVAYGNIVGVLIEAIKELTSRVEALERQQR